MLYKREPIIGQRIMNEFRAAEIIASIGQGKNPVKPDETSLFELAKEPEVQAALKCAIAAIARERSSRSDKPLPARNGENWSNEEDDQLRKEHAANQSISEIALLHRRTNGAIRSQMAKLGLIDDSFSR